ncbi:MAG: hypothetical protein WBA93_35010 [Microcoleaceae cyanobacterium]
MLWIETVYSRVDGKDSSVVAEEISKLINESIKLTDHIGILVRDIQAAINLTIVIKKVGIKYLQQITQIAESRK